MNYKKSELRNNHMALLRRTQRIVDKGNEKKAESFLGKEKQMKGQAIMFDEASSFELPISKTKLNLYDKRGKR